MNEVEPIPLPKVTEETLQKMAELQVQMKDYFTAHGLTLDDFFRGLHTPTDKMKEYSENKENT